MSISVEVRVPFLDLRAQYVSIKDEIDEAVRTVVASGHYVGGEWVERFEDQFSRLVGAEHAVAVGSGTAALELAFRAAGIRAGDEIIVPANSFFATAEAVSNMGARPVFVDVNPQTFHLDPASVESHLTPRTRAIVPVHLYGRVADLTEIEQLAKTFSLEIIEDACQAHGVRRNGIHVGGSGRLTCFSFYPGKNLGAYGDGGAVTCNDPKQAQLIRTLRDHGSPVKYQHVAIGTNSRLDGIQAAILCLKLRHLDAWNARRFCHAESYVRALQGRTVEFPELPPQGEHNFHLFVIRTEQRDAMKTFLRQRGIETGIHYPISLHLTPAYQAMGYPGPGSLPEAERLAGEILSLPMYPELTDNQINIVVSAVEEFCSSAETKSKVFAVSDQN